MFVREGDREGGESVSQPLSYMPHGSHMLSIKTGMVSMTESVTGFRTVLEELNLQRLLIYKTTLILVLNFMVR